MKTNLVMLTSGLLAGVALVLSCGDDMPAHADAGACTCPAAEPPISGRIMVVSTPFTVPPNDRAIQFAACPAGAAVLTGSCTADSINPPHDMVIEQSGFYEDDSKGWYCDFRNNEAAAITAKVSVRCLVPAQ